MFFAEVRPFEEIFRQGEQPPAGSAENEEQQGGQNAQEAGQLAELQKQIINGTWKLIRRETRSKPTDTFAEDAKTLARVAEGRDRAGRPARRAAARRDVEGEPGTGRQCHEAGREAPRPTPRTMRRSRPSTPALVAEQAAYQALLKLRAREFQVIRQNSRSRSRSSRSSRQPVAAAAPAARPVQRGEPLRGATHGPLAAEPRPSASASRRENRQVLNRLRELAQRQRDLNERLKELQSALEAAKTPEAREEIERQLKRLRDQQQEILRDTDELRERMENEENQQRMAEARQQIEQSREHVRQASQALEEGRLPQALTEGARAGRQLNDLREQLRKETSNRFSEEMTEMRDQARRLDENQKKITEQLEAWTRSPSSRSASPRSASRSRGRRAAEQASSNSSSTGCATRPRRPRKPSRSWPRSFTTPSARPTSRRSPRRSRPPSSWSTPGSPRRPPRRRGTPARVSSNCAQGVERAARVRAGRRDRGPPPRPGRARRPRRPGQSRDRPGDRTRYAPEPRAGPNRDKSNDAQRNRSRRTGRGGP